MHIAADHLFFKHVGLSSERATVAEMVYHMGMADRAFRATDFNQDGGSGDGIGFVIAAVTVFHNETSEGRLIKIKADKDVKGESISMFIPSIRWVYLIGNEADRGLGKVN